ncbi:glutathione S-transferase family protein [Marinobacter sp.]|uniref:glutathione S-transferase family protein n=1 Tax=Marinobacter sp. TaxID=50741 RepID=UPI0038501646
MSIKLFQFAISHYCEKSRWALDFKGIQYQTVNLLPGTHVKTIRRLADGSSVPVLEHDGKAVQGSARIIDYLDENFPDHPLTPEDPEEKAEAEAWEGRLDERAGVAVRCYCYHHLLKKPDLVVPLLAAQKPMVYRWGMRLGFSRLEDSMRRWMNINDRTAAAAQVTMENILAALEAAYGQSEYLTGNRFSRADLTAAALFSPLFMPARYPVAWPDRKQLPVEMQRWLDKNQWLLQPLEAIYQNHR